ncbi:helix-hairpin-helix domain-containing protein [Echinicola soli]|uniref:Helix-hairpin-helix domain-containing protein n=1 Tax=Echinicola soli TaxID=2591634 RepID=A0A514CCS8_9BACT|nr:helix-hairpin-helix domain-containing protein [Echinicola soli]QDH77627.1 helix-hairpin-helix domain-containing protein [Echinicola soli]
MKKKLHYFLREYFGFTKRESNGFLLVVPVLVVLAFVPKGVKWYQSKAAMEQYQQYLARTDSLLAVMEDDSSAGGFVRVANRQVRKDTGRWEEYQSKKPTLNKMDFAEADSVVLQVVPGIGPALAARIVKFRESLGGLHRQEQLLDVYGLKVAVAKRVFEYFTFTPSIGHHLSLNAAGTKDLAAHPYIRYGEAKVIVAYRDQHGEYQQIEDLLNIKILSKDWLERVKPCLQLD